MKYRSIDLALIAAAIFVMSAMQVQTASAQSPPPAPVAPAAGAPPPPPKGAMRTACGADITSFCPGLKGQDARKCLRAHRAEISPSCVAYLKARRAAAKAKAMNAPPPGSPPPAGAPLAPPTGSDQH
jgi:hypothetical protein